MLLTMCNSVFQTRRLGIVIATKKGKHNIEGLQCALTAD